jgi:hypothetical protein
VYLHWRRDTPERRSTLERRNFFSNIPNLNALSKHRHFFLPAILPSSKILSTLDLWSVWIFFSWLSKLCRTAFKSLTYSWGAVRINILGFTKTYILTTHLCKEKKSIQKTDICRKSYKLRITSNEIFMELSPPYIFHFHEVYNKECSNQSQSLVEKYFISFIDDRMHCCISSFVICKHQQFIIV